MLSVNQQNFTKEVLESSVPVLVHFQAPWCGLCRLINPTLNQFQAESGNNIKIFSVNADENFQLATSYRLKTLPTLIIFSQGTGIYRLEGFKGREQLKSELQKALSKINVLVKSV